MIRYTIGCAVKGLILLCAFLYLIPNLCGWKLANLSDTKTIVESTWAGKAAFAIGVCVPNMVDPWNVPAAKDGQQFDSQTMLTCRSHASVLRAVSIYLLIALAGLALIQRCQSVGGKEIL